MGHSSSGYSKFGRSLFMPREAYFFLTIKSASYSVLAFWNGGGLLHKEVLEECIFLGSTYRTEIEYLVSVTPSKPFTSFKVGILDLSMRLLLQ
jgi:hypothetical protein